MTHVLVVDDNRKIVSVLEEYLAAEGYETTVAYDGEAALAALAQNRFDIALLDIMLPGIGGIELTPHFERARVPVIFVSARKDEIDRLVGLEVGADDYVTKPFSPREVVARVKAVLRRAARSNGGEGSDRILIRSLAIDLDQRSVFVGEDEVHLTKAEFEILTALAQSVGRVLSRHQLMEASAGELFDGYERTIDAHISNIRRKLGDRPRSPNWIHTVIGVGYKIEGPQ